MRNIKKKLSVLIAGTLLACSAVSLGACSGYNPKALSGDISGDVTSNGGFVVEKGNYVYFINGQEDASADNTYGDVVKGALYRITKSDLKSGKYDTAERVVSSLFVSQEYDGGVFIYGDYVYFASPTTEKEKDGSVSNSWLSFKRAKLNGSSSQKEIDDYLFRLDDNSVSYRFVEKDGTVYCLYVDDSKLYSFNVSTKTTTLLVSGASTYYFDTENLENGSVYYLMSVPTDITADASTYQYNQVYCVEPDATATVDANNTSYTVTGYRTYSFNRKSLEDNNSSFDATDISQYPYINLGRLVIDGRGSGEPQSKTQYNDTDDVNGAKIAGYTYALLAYRNSRLLFTRVDNDPVTDDVPVYTLTDAEKTADWNAVKANDNFMMVADTSDYATASAVYYEAGNNALGYLYVSNSNIYRTVVNADGTIAEDSTLLSAATVTNLWTTDGTYLYYYGSADSGNNLYRLNYTGNADDYNPLLQPDKEHYAEYAPSQILDVQWNDSWYKPEFAENVLLYSNAQSFGSTAFNYIYAANLNGASGMMTANELNALNEKYEEVTDYIDDFSDIGDDGDDFVLALKYYFRTGETTAYDEFLAEAKKQGYKDYYRYGDFAQAEFKAFTTHTANGDNDYSEKFKDENGNYYDVESYYIRQIGETKSADEESIEKIWRTNFIEPLPEEEDDGAWSTAKNVWVSIAVVGGSLLVIAAIVVPIVITKKKKAKAAADREATAVKKPKIDTNVDDSIDVYAVDEPEKQAEEAEVESEAEKEADTTANEAAEETESTPDTQSDTNEANE